MAYMGAFFTNVQLRVPEGFDVEELQELLKRVAEEDGFEASDAQNATRTIAIAQGRRWMAIYDQATEDQGPELDRLAKRVSRAEWGPVVSVLVHDSDIAQLCLFEAGQCIDTYNSYPDYFEEADLSEAELAGLRGDAEKWLNVLNAGRTAADLRKCWNQDATFAEDIVSDVAQLLGCAGVQMTQGYRYLEETAEGPLLRLHFRRKHASTSQEEASEGEDEFRTDEDGVSRGWPARGCAHGAGARELGAASFGGARGKPLHLLGDGVAQARNPEDRRRW